MNLRLLIGVVIFLAAAQPLSAAGEQASEALSGTVVFETADGIHFVAADGTGLRRLPGSVPGDQDPRWSPDGRKIAFWNGTADGQESVFTVNADGSDRQQLGDGEYPTWSPDGTRIVFDSAREGDWYVYVMQADGSRVRRVNTGAYAGWYPSWTPSGEVSFDAGKADVAVGEDYPRNGIMVAGTDGADLRRVPTLHDDDWWSSWSPDGSCVAFTTTIGKKSQIGLVGADGSPLLLSKNQWTDQGPRWTPDGRHILFTSERNGLGEIYVMDADGSHQRRITHIAKAYAWGGDLKP